MPITNFQNWVYRSELFSMQISQLSMATVLNQHFLKLGYSGLMTKLVRTGLISEVFFFFFLIVEGPTSGIYLKLEGVTVPLTVWVWFQAFWQLSCNTIFCPWANKESRVRNKSGIKYWTLWWRQVKWKLIQDLTLLEVHLCISHWYTVVLWD